MSPKIIDLSVELSKDTQGVKVNLQDKLPVYLGHECYAYDLEIKSHTGTYFETSSHVFRNGKDTDQIPLEELVLPGVCIKVTEEKKCIDADDLELLCGSIEPNRALLVDVGKDTQKYFSRCAASWMAEKQVALMGSNTTCYDTGFVKPTGFFVELFQAEIPIIAVITNLNLLPETGFTLIVLPLRIKGVCTVPCRVIAMIV